MAGETWAAGKFTGTIPAAPSGREIGRGWRWTGRMLLVVSSVQNEQSWETSTRFCTPSAGSGILLFLLLSLVQEHKSHGLKDPLLHACVQFYHQNSKWPPNKVKHVLVSWSLRMARKGSASITLSRYSPVNSHTNLYKVQDFIDHQVHSVKR
jgi:hypothetical protein